METHVSFMTYDQDISSPVGRRGPHCGEKKSGKTEREQGADGGSSGLRPEHRNNLLTICVSLSLCESVYLSICCSY